MNSATLTLLICYLGGPGTAQQAQPVVDQFLRHLETSAGWGRGASRGAYRTTLDACEAYVKQEHPQLLVLQLPDYLKLSQRWRLAPLAHMGGAGAKRYYLLVRDGSYATVGSLKGKTVLTQLSEDPRFVNAIVFDEATREAAATLRLKATPRPLTGIRAVARKAADAVLVDESAYAHLRQLTSLPQPLKAIHQSAPLPGLTLAVVKPRASKKLIADVSRTLPKLCLGEGQSLCRSFEVKSFVPAKASVYSALQEKYDRGSPEEKR